MKKLVFSGVFSLFLFMPIFALADISDTEIVYHSGSLSSDTIWSPEDGVHIIDGNFSVPIGITLTIEEGAIIKIGKLNRDGIDVYGKLIVQGTSDLPVYFTSFFNDDIGGNSVDYGHDGPKVGDWRGIHFKSGSNGIFEYVDVSYAGRLGFGMGYYAGIENDGGSIEIKNSNIHDNFIGVQIDSGESYISDSIFSNNGNCGVYAYGSGLLTLIDNEFYDNARVAEIEVSKQFVHSGNISQNSGLNGFEISGDVIEDNVLDSNDLPILMPGGISISEGKTLTIEPGTIIKLGNAQGGGIILVRGNLVAKSTDEEKIYFTSYKDDEVGGDSNGDNNASSPNKSDWAGIVLEEGSKVEFEDVVVRFGGRHGFYISNLGATILNIGGELLISDSKIEQNNGYAIFQDFGFGEIANSEISDQFSGLLLNGGSFKISKSSLITQDIAVFNQDHSHPDNKVDARDNWWGSVNGPNDTSSPTPTGSGSNISSKVEYLPFLTSWPPIDENPEDEEQEEDEPEDEDPEEEEQELNPVIIIPGIMGSARKNGQLMIDPILHTYDDLIATLVANGYEKEKTLFTFPYEWKDSNVLNANLLKEKISEVQGACTEANLSEISCDKVDLVTHSMGGLVARKYVQSGQYNDDVDQMIFLGTPHKGAPEAYLEWEAGDFKPGLFNKLKAIFFHVQSLNNGYSNVFEYIHGRPIISVNELLPMFDYIKDKENGNLREYPNNYPKNEFLENLNKSSSLSKLLESEIEITNIVGNTGNNTIEKVVVVPELDSGKWSHGKVDSFEFGVGDGTVPEYSSSLDGSITDEKWNEVSHGELPRETSGRIFNILTGQLASNVVYLAPIEKILSIQLQSPVDILVTAPDGKKIGKNFETGAEYDEIVRAFYSGYQDGEEYITIPNPLDGEYKIELQGTDGGGEFGVVTSFIDNENSVSQLYEGDIAEEEVKEASISLETSNQENPVMFSLIEDSVDEEENENEDENDEEVDEENNEEANSNLDNSYSQSSSSSSRSRNNTNGQVLGIYTSSHREIAEEDTQIEIMKKFVAILSGTVKVLNIYLSLYYN
jgi:hypothetical protein